MDRQDLDTLHYEMLYIGLSCRTSKGSIWGRMGDIAVMVGEQLM